jgi:hypothetical protein
VNKAAARKANRRRNPLAALALAGSAGAVLPAAAVAPAQVPSLATRVEAVRATLARTEAGAAAQPGLLPGVGGLVAQANNWTNWPKWSKWSNWSNK